MSSTNEEAVNIPYNGKIHRPDIIDACFEIAAKTSFKYGRREIVAVVGRRATLASKKRPRKRERGSCGAKK